MIGEPEDIGRRDPDQDGADPRDRKECGRYSGRDRKEDDRRADGDPEEVRAGAAYAIGRACSDQADRRGAGAAHDRQRDEHEGPDRSPTDPRYKQLVRHHTRYTFDPWRRR